MRHHKDCVPLYGLIKTQLKAEKMSYGDLLRGMSYGNMAKAERRLQTLLAAEAIIDAAKQKKKRGHRAQKLCAPCCVGGHLFAPYYDCGFCFNRRHGALVKSGVRYIAAANYVCSANEAVQ